VALVAAGLGAAMLVAAMVTAWLWTTGWSPFEKPQPDEVLGAMRDASDQSDIGDAPTKGGTVLAIPQAATRDFWQRSSIGAAPGPDQLSYASFSIPMSAMPAMGALTGTIGRHGRFSLRPVASGAYLLCYAGESRTADYQVQGCGEASLQVPGRIEASRGEAGFRVTVSGGG